MTLQFRVKLALSLALPLVSFSSFSTPTIYGLQKASQFRSNSSGDFYIQVASFRNKANAVRTKSSLQSKSSQPIWIREKMVTMLF